MSRRHHDTARGPGGFSRRQLLRLAAAGAAVTSTSGWIERLAEASASDPKRRRSCILLWMNGGPSQIDTFDPKPDAPENIRGEFGSIETSVPGIRLSEHLPGLATQMNDMAVFRSMTSKEGDHGRASYNLHTGYVPQGPIAFPTLGALIAKELENRETELPNFVSIAPYRQFNPAAYSSGFLGHDFAPLIVGEGQGGACNEGALKVDDLEPAESPGSGVGGNPLVRRLGRSIDSALGYFRDNREDARLDLLGDLDGQFMEGHGGIAPRSHRVAYDRAIKLMRSTSVKAFDLSEEPDALRDAYGRNLFGQGCLLARRLVERGVPFVEVTLNSVPDLQVFGWDTHQQNFEAVRTLSQVLDAGWSTLMTDLRGRGLLDDTLIVWMGEFGRTPQVNANAGRDHFPTAWSTVLAGGGVRGGQVVGDSGPDGMKVVDRPVKVPDFLATVCAALGIDHRAENLSNLGRPIRIVELGARPVQEVLS